MKFMSREFNRTEKILIGVLVVILLALFYYYFVDQNVRATVDSANSEAEMLQMQVDTAQYRILYLSSLKDKMDELEADDNLTWMGSYNNSKAEVAFLNDILADTLQYSVSFAEVTRNGDQIRRSFTLQYQTADYAAAQEIFDRLCAGENRCLVGDVRCAINNDGTVAVSESATFYETMVGGTPDAGLPVDRAAVNN